MSVSVEIHLPLFVVTASEDNNQCHTVKNRALSAGPQETRGNLETHSSCIHLVLIFYSLVLLQGSSNREGLCFWTSFYQLVYLRSMPPQAPQHRTVHCPQLIDKTCSTVCCTH